MELAHQISRRMTLRASLGIVGGIFASALLSACGDDDDDDDSEDAQPEATATATSPPSGGDAPTNTPSGSDAPTNTPASTATEAGDEPSSTATEPADDPAEATIEELRIGLPALPWTLDPQTTTAIVTRRVGAMIFDTLIRHDWSASGELVPSLATSWERLDDLTIEFALRDDVVWHDGTPFTAEDVRYTFERTLREDPNIGVNGVFPIAAIEVLDDHRVRFVTDGPDGAFENRLAEEYGGIVPAAYVEEIGFDAFQTRPMGTGPYRLVDFVADSHVTLEANEQYFAGRPAADRVEVRGVPEVATRIAGLLNDELDIILDVPSDQIATVEERGRFAIDSVSPLNANVLNMNGILPPTDNKLVRQALDLSIDRETIVEQLLEGHGLWARSVQSEFDPLYIERPPRPYDPERAKELLAEAGYDGEEINYVYDAPNYYPLQREWTEVVIAGWREVGFNVTIHPMEVSQRVEITADDPFNLVTNSSNGMADLDLSRNFANNAGLASRFPPGALDELQEVVAEAQATIDPDERAQLYQRALDLIHDEVMVIVLYTINRISAISDAVQWSADPAWGIDLRRGKLEIA
jgi:peptide/nickel transport system substrate-binding protein